MGKSITKFIVTTALAVALLTITGQYIFSLIPPQLVYGILYFIVANKLITAYEQQQTKD